MHKESFAQREASGHYHLICRALSVARAATSRGGRLPGLFERWRALLYSLALAAVLVAAVRGNNWQLAEVPQGTEAAPPARAAKLAASVA